MYGWARTYKSVFETPAKHRPRQTVIENDVQFDRWLRQQDEASLSKDGKTEVNVPEFTGVPIR